MPILFLQGMLVFEEGSSGSILITMFWIIFFLAVGGGGGSWALNYLWRRKNSTERRKKKKLPPGPSGLPLIGNLHKLGELPHHDLHNLAKQYGPIMYLRLGCVPTVVVSSPEAAENFLKVHDLSLATRPFISAGECMSYGSTGLGFSEYGPYWRNVRKLYVQNLLSQTKIDSFKSMREQELGLLVQSLRVSSNEHATVDLSAKVSSLTADIMCRMVFGRKYTDDNLDAKGFKVVIQEAMELTAAFNVADYVPYVGVLDLQGLTRRMKAVSKELDVFLEKMIGEHIAIRSSSSREETDLQDDFVDVLLSLLEDKDEEFQINRTNIKVFMLDMLSGGLDTSATAIEWIISELLRNPSVMKKVQEELERVVGKERFVEESDLVHLEYLEMVVKESMRLHPVAPLALPHEAIEDCEIDGFHIPRKMQIIINIWAIGRDSSAWVDADRFYPERFIGKSTDLKGQHFQLIPFGSGRRRCPGMQLGLTVLRFATAQLVHCFNWELPFDTSPSNLDMREVFGLTVPRATHLLAIPTFRLSNKL